MGMSDRGYSWQPASGPDMERVIESNWLFTLRTRRFTSRHSGKSHDFYQMEIPDAVHVIAVTTDRKLVMVRQFRAGSGRDSLETPGGLIEPGELPEVAGARELREETGYQGDEARRVSQVWAVPSILTNRITTILVENARLVASPSLDPTEEVRVELVDVDHLPALLRNGEIDHALVAQGLLDLAHGVTYELRETRSGLSPVSRASCRPSDTEMVDEQWLRESGLPSWEPRCLLDAFPHINYQPLFINHLSVGSRQADWPPATVPGEDSRRPGAFRVRIASALDSSTASRAREEAPARLA